jgi:type I restriction enzyme S subunit
MQQSKFKINSENLLLADASKRFYEKTAVIYFCKVKESFGKLGNMGAGFGIRVNTGLVAASVENLYQMMRFTQYPAIQDEILTIKQGYGAKLKAKKYRKTHTRSDFESHRIEIMRWCLRLKLAHHPQFGELLLATGIKEIVELSKFDDFWGCIELTAGLLYGGNELGRLLVDLREEYRQSLSECHESFKQVSPPEITDFYLLGQPIQTIDLRTQTYQPNLISEALDVKVVESGYC